MKRIFIILALILSSFSIHAQREFYDRYASREDVVVVYAHGYLLDSANRVDAILIQANDSAAWEWMKEEFSIEPHGEQDLRRISAGKDVRIIRKVNCEDLRISPINDENRDFVLSGSHDYQFICVFFTENMHQIQILFQNYVKTLNNTQQ